MASAERNTVLESRFAKSLIVSMVSYEDQQASLNATGAFQ